MKWVGLRKALVDTATLFVIGGFSHFGGKRVVGLRSLRRGINVTTMLCLDNFDASSDGVTPYLCN